MDSQEEVIADYHEMARWALKLFGDKAYFELIERITVADDEHLKFIPFWRGVLKALDEVRKEES